MNFWDKRRFVFNTKPLRSGQIEDVSGFSISWDKIDTDDYIQYSIPFCTAFVQSKWHDISVAFQPDCISLQSKKRKKHRKTNWITTVAACSVHGFVETILYVIYTTTHLIMRPIEQIGCLGATASMIWTEEEKKMSENPCKITCRKIFEKE